MDHWKMRLTFQIGCEKINWKIFRMANTTWREVLTAMKRKILLLTLALAAALLLAPRAMAAEGGAGQPSGPDWTVFSEDNQIGRAHV